jgi:hypothetical protein
VPLRGAQRARLVVVCAAALAGACHSAAPPARAASLAGADATPVADSIEGIVRVVGLDALPVITLAFDNGAPSLTLDGPASLRRATGLRVAIVGTRNGSHFTVRRFTVVSANGVSATDGVIAEYGDALVLVTSDGARHKLVSPPTLLRQNIGHRVWVSGPLTREPVAYGILD